MQLLLVDPQQCLPDGLADLLGRSGWQVRQMPDYATAAEAVDSAVPDAIVVPEPPALAGRRALCRVAGTAATPGRGSASPEADNGDGPALPAGSHGGGHGGFRRLLRAIEDRQVATVMVSKSRTGAWREESPFIDIAAGNVTKEEIRGRVSTLMRYHPLVKRLERELKSMQRLSKRLNQHFTEIDQELQLAGRLQRDFLPHPETPIGPAEFATLFRPASWVSGDIYDIYRVDEDHIAFYVADAVGHGVAASLLTMFIKKAIVSKRITADTYELLSPPETMQGLNTALVEQSLPNCQFVTACYCLLNTRTLELDCCRGGHPYPLLVEPDGRAVELKPSGGLLGLFEDEEFPAARVQMAPGQKLLLYTDGFELAFAPGPNRPDDASHYRRVLEELSVLPIAEIVRRLNDQLNDESGSLNPRDDVTLVAMEIAAN